MKTVCTQSFQETQKLGKELAKKLTPGQTICLSGDLGSGKTTFAQGLLKGLNVKGPYTSPTFLIIKQYHIIQSIKQKSKKIKMLHASCPASRRQAVSTSRGGSIFHDVYHIDAYRVSDKDILNLGWEEIISQPGNLIVVEWAERIKKIIPKNAKWINFSWEGKEKRKIVFN